VPSRPSVHRAERSQIGIVRGPVAAGDPVARGWDALEPLCRKPSKIDDGNPPSPARGEGGCPPTPDALRRSTLDLQGLAPTTGFGRRRATYLAERTQSRCGVWMTQVSEEYRLASMGAFRGPRRTNPIRERSRTGRRGSAFALRASPGDREGSRVAGRAPGLSNDPPGDTRCTRRKTALDGAPSAPKTKLFRNLEIQISMEARFSAGRETTTRRSVSSSRRLDRDARRLGPLSRTDRP